MDAQAHHQRARTKGVNPVLYRIVRLILVPIFRLYFRMERHGIEHIPERGPLLLAANHRSFLDPFVLGTMTGRPLYYVAKKELFANRVVAWFLSALGAFPVDRGRSDQEMLETARQILARGDAVLIFPEGTRIRPGGLGQPRRGIGRLALETGAPVVPLAVVGTEGVRRGWRVRPHRVRIRAGRPLTYPHVEHPSRQLAQAVTDRIWPCVQLQWEWLGGLPPIRHATVVGAGSWGTAVAAALARAGVDVELGAADLTCADADAVLFAVAPRDLPDALAAHAGRIPQDAGVAMLSARRDGAHVVVAGGDHVFAARLGQAFRAAGLDAAPGRDAAALDLGALEDLTTPTGRTRAAA